MRIVSLVPAGTDILYALGLGSHVVGVSHECDYPADARPPRLTRSVVETARLSSAETARLSSAAIHVGHTQSAYCADSLARVSAVSDTASHQQPPA